MATKPPDKSLRDYLEKNDGKVPNVPFPDIVRPTPDAAEGEPGWTKLPTIDPLEAQCSVSGHVIVTPYGDDHMSQIARTHEMAHARFTSESYSPPEQRLLDTLHPISIQFAEDALLNYKLKWLGLPADCENGSGCAHCLAHYKNTVETLQDNILVHLPKDKAVKVGAVWASVKMNSPYYTSFTTGIPPIIWTEVNKTIQSNKATPIQKRLLIAKALTDYLGAFEAEARAEKEQEAIESGSRKGWREADAKAKEALSKLPPPPRYDRDARDEALITDLGCRDGSLTGQPNWLIPKILFPPLQAAKGIVSYGIGPSETGAMFRYPHRLHIDRMIFGARRRARGAAVLLDCSGSMGLTWTHVYEIVKHFPAGIVAGYSGDRLYIFAENGRMVSEEWMRTKYEVRGSNESDGPALEWLAKQRGRKFWISDQQVTEAGESLTVRGYRYCMKIVRRNNITIVENVHTFLNRLKSSRPKASKAA